MAKKLTGDWRDPVQVEEWVQQILRELLPAEVDVRRSRQAIVLPEQRAGSPAPVTT